MTDARSKLKLLKRVVAVRVRLRDVAAGAASAAAAHALLAVRGRDDADRVREQHTDSAEGRIAEARGGGDLAQYADERVSARLAVHDADRVVASTRRESDRARAALAVRERQLRGVEHARDRVRVEVTRDADRAEQAAVDDIVGARLGRRE